MENERDTLARVAKRAGLKVPEGWSAQEIAEAIAAHDAPRAHRLRVPSDLQAEWEAKLGREGAA